MYAGMFLARRIWTSWLAASMEFCQYQYPLTKVGPGYFYDSYKSEFKLSSHVPDGQ